MGTSDARLEQRLHQQAVVAELGQRALETDDLEQLMHETCVSVAETLENDFCKVLELLPGGDAVFLREGIGWRECLVGSATVPTDVESQAGYTLISEEPVIVDDLRTEERFSGPELLTSHDVVGGISVIIGSVDEPWGVLGTHTTDRRNFTEHDAAFVQSVANVLASAIERSEREERLAEERKQWNQLVDAIEEYAICRLDATGRVISWNQGAEQIIGYSETEILGDHVSTFFAEDADTENYVHDLLAQARDEGSVEDEGWRVRKDGTRFWARDTYTALTDANGDPRGYIKVTRDLTERRQREQALQRDAAIMDALGDPVYALDAEGRLTYVNDALLEWTGYHEEEALLGEHVSVGLPDEEIERIEAAMAELLAEDPHGTIHVEFEVDVPGGEPRLVENHISLLLEDGELAGSAGALRDITERRQREQSLAQYRALTEAATDVIVTIDEDSVIQTVNPAVEDLFGYEPAELEGESLTVLMPDELAPRHRRAVERYLNTGERNVDWEYVEFSGRHADGSEIPLAISFSEVEHGGAHFFTGIIRDITDRKEHERELGRLLDLLQHTERTADVGGWEVNPQTKEVFWSDQLFDILGVEGDEEPPLEEALEVYHEADRSLVADAIERSLDSGEPLDVDARFVTPDGEVRWLHVQGVPEVDDGGDVALRGAAQDITERKRRERALEESHERLEEFASAVSHDLREPLSTVASYLQLLERRYEEDLDEDAQEFVDFAVDGATRMQEMIDGLVTTYARVDTEGKPIEPVDLDPVVDDVLVDLDEKIAATDADITVEPLPTIAGDRGQLRQLFMNLVDNAIKYAGDEPPRIHVAAEREGERYQIAVSDDGIGIDPEAAEKAFDVFSRLHPGEEYPGSGIGLALCERIVERHSGDIWVESEPGAGSTFFFTLPAAGEQVS